MSDDRDPKDASDKVPAAMSEDALRARLRRARAEATEAESTGATVVIVEAEPAPGSAPEAASDGGAAGGGASGGGASGGSGGGKGGGADDEGADDAPFSLDEVDLRDALRGALRPPAGTVAPRLLPSVQRKIRIRSRGKFYGDGWSTADKPRSTYLVTSILMLVVIALVFLALVPWSVANLR